MLIYEPDTGRLLRKNSATTEWRTGEKWRVVGHKRGDMGYLYAMYKGRCRPVAHWAWELMTGTPVTMTIDHINRDPTDNRWCNLRHVSQGENNRNRAPYTHKRAAGDLQ